MILRVSVLLPVLLAVSLAACGSDSPKPPTLASLAKQAGCADLKRVDAEVFVKDQGTCIKDDRSLGLFTFNTKNARDDWLDVAHSKGTIKHGGRWATLTSPAGSTTTLPSNTKKQATTPAERARQTKLCDELFSPDLEAPPGTHAMDLIYDYLQDDPNNPTLDAKTATEVGDDLREVSARAPEWLAPHVAEMADGLDLLRKIAAEKGTADGIDAATFADLVAGGKATLAICLPPNPEQ